MTLHVELLQQQTRFPLKVAAHVEADPEDAITQAPKLLMEGACEKLRLLILEHTNGVALILAFTTCKRVNEFTAFKDATLHGCLPMQVVSHDLPCRPINHPDGRIAVEVVIVIVEVVAGVLSVVASVVAVVEVEVEVV